MVLRRLSLMKNGNYLVKVAIRLTLACTESFRPPQIRQERTGLKPVKKAVSKRGRPQQWNPDKQEQKIITLHSHRGRLKVR